MKLIIFLYAAADDDPLPAIEVLQISGEAVPGRELQACGYSINGTTSCNFEVPFQDLFESFISFYGIWLQKFLKCTMKHIISWNA